MRQRARDAVARAAELAEHPVTRAAARTAREQLKHLGPAFADDLIWLAARKAAPQLRGQRRLLLALSAGATALSAAATANSVRETRLTRAQINAAAEKVLERGVPPEGILRKGNMNINNGAMKEKRYPIIAEFIKKQGIALQGLQEFDEEYGTQWILHELNKGDREPPYACLHGLLPGDEGLGPSKREQTGLAFIYDTREVELLGHMVIALPKLGRLGRFESWVMKDGVVEQRYALIAYFRDRRTGEIHGEVNAHLDAAGDGGPRASERGTTHRTVQMYAINQAFLDLEEHLMERRPHEFNTDPNFEHAIKVGPAVSQHQLGVSRAFLPFRTLERLYDSDVPTYRVVAADLNGITGHAKHHTAYVDANAGEVGAPARGDDYSAARGIDRIKMPLLHGFGMWDPSEYPTHDYGQGWDDGSAHRASRGVGKVAGVRGAITKGLNVERSSVFDVLMVSPGQKVVENGRMVFAIPGPNHAEGGREASDHRMMTVDVIRNLPHQSP
jgi:hypothetical protein